jgi:hypothetical protein
MSGSIERSNMKTSEEIINAQSAGIKDLAMTITIHRTRLDNVPGKNYKFAWRYLYSYSIDGADPISYDTRLKATISYLKRTYKGAIIYNSFIDL